MAKCGIVADDNEVLCMLKTIVGRKHPQRLTCCGVLRMNISTQQGQRYVVNDSYNLAIDSQVLIIRAKHIIYTAGE
jgi:hypothetical protein